MYNELTLALSIFFLAFAIIHTWKPILVYDDDGHIRHFGIASSKRTVVPLFVVAILLAIFAFTISILIIQ